jgi:hypothetical protein
MCLYICFFNQQEESEFNELWRKATEVIDINDKEAVMRKKIEVYKLHQMENKLRFKLWRCSNSMKLQEGQVVDLDVEDKRESDLSTNTRVTPTIQDISSHACAKFFGSYGRGLLCLTRKLQNACAQNAVPHEQGRAEEAHHVNNTSASATTTSASSSSMTSSSAKVVAPSRQAAIKAYQSFISGVFVASGLHMGPSSSSMRSQHSRNQHSSIHHSGNEFHEAQEVKLNQNQRRALKEYRDREFISDEEHIIALSELGLDSQDVDLLSPSSSSSSSSSSTSSRYHQESEDVESPTNNNNNNNSSGSSPVETSRSVCIVCMEQPPTLACVPCGHVCMCEDDAVAFSRQADRRCPICRNHVQAIMKVYL